MRKNRTSVALVLSALKATGVFRLWQYWHRNSINILMVHGTMSPDLGRTTWTPLRPQTDPRILEESLRILSDFYHFVSLDDALDMLSGRKPMLPYCTVLTFDDGYRNNVRYAFPILEKLGIPATFYITSGHVEERKPLWYDRIDYALQQLNSEEISMDTGERILTISTRCRDGLRKSFKTFRDLAKETAGDDLGMIRNMETLASRLEEQAGKRLADILDDDDWTAFATWDDLLHLPELFTLGCHTVDHVQLGRTDAETVRDQLIRSKELIEAKIGRQCQHLCYPNGNYTLETARIARECGFRSAVTVQEGVNRPGDDSMTLSRFPFPDSDENILAIAKASGFINAFKSIMRTKSRTLRTGK